MHIHIQKATEDVQSGKNTAPGSGDFLSGLPQENFTASLDRSKYDASTPSRLGTTALRAKTRRVFLTSVNCQKTNGSICDFGQIAGRKPRRQLMCPNFSSLIYCRNSLTARNDGRSEKHLQSLPDFSVASKSDLRDALGKMLLYFLFFFLFFLFCSILKKFKETTKSTGHYVTSASLRQKSDAPSRCARIARPLCVLNG